MTNPIEPTATDVADDETHEPKGNRRAILGLAGAGIAGAAVLGKSAVASAADGDDVLVGGAYEGDTATTFDNTTATADIAGDANALKGTISQAGNGSHAILGETLGGGHAIAGDVPAGTGNTVGATWGRHGGEGAGAEGVNTATDVDIAGDANGVKGTIQDEDEAVTGAPTTGVHRLGELYADGVGGLYYNQGDGLNFTRISQQVFLNDNPVRAYDSRPGEEPLTSEKGRTSDQEIRTINIGDFVDTTTATAAIINITVTDTDDGGFLSVFNADTDDADAPETASINWFMEGQTVGNGQTVRLSSDGMIKVRSRNATHFVIDVTGVVA